jgi:hypothetical protein
MAPNALHALKMIGATKTAGILQRTISMFPNSVVPADQKQRRELMCDSLTPEDGDLLEQLDKEFYEGAEPVDDLMHNYIKAHPQEFPT